MNVTDSFNPPLSASQAFTMNVLNNVVVPNTTLPDAVKNLAYMEQIKAFGGTPPYRFVLNSGALPAGLVLDPNTGNISGIPTAITNAFFSLTVSDSAAPTPGTAHPFMMLNVQPPLSIESSSFPDSAKGLGYFGSILPAGGRPPYTAQVSAGALPDGLTIHLLQRH